jgi:hypothetical protein
VALAAAAAAVVRIREGDIPQEVDGRWGSAGAVADRVVAVEAAVVGAPLAVWGRHRVGRWARVGGRVLLLEDFSLLL